MHQLAGNGITTLRVLKFLQESGTMQALSYDEPHFLFPVRMIKDFRPDLLPQLRMLGKTRGTTSPSW